MSLREFLGWLRNFGATSLLRTPHRTAIRTQILHRHPRRAENLETRCLLAAVAWDGGAGTTNWMDAANWNNDIVPTSADDVTITGGTVSLATSVSLRSLVLSNSAINVGASITIETTNNVNLTNSSRILTVDNNLTVFANRLGTGTGTFAGVDINSSRIESSGVGQIYLYGQGSGAAGILLRNSARIVSLSRGSGAITLQGQGGAGALSSHGVYVILDSDIVSQNSAPITVLGIGGTSTNGAGVWPRACRQKNARMEQR